MQTYHTVEYIYCVSTLVNRFFDNCRLSVASVKTDKFEDLDRLFLIVYLDGIGANSMHELTMNCHHFRIVQELLWN